MKTNRFLKFLTLAFCAVAFAFVTGCEGPEGPVGPKGDKGDTGDTGATGAAGADGADANETCKQCHNEETLVLNAKMQQFEAGDHAMGTYYTRGGECAACHNNEGFLARIDDNGPTDIYSFAGPAETQISCYTCHPIHDSYTTDDWGLTLATKIDSTILGTKTAAITPKAFLDKGNSNMCFQCHQSRDRGNVPVPGQTEDVEITSSHWGPHYGVQGNVFHASGGVNLTGSEDYPAEDAGKHTGIETGCIQCHMYEGDHSLKVDNKSCAPCHTESEAETKYDALHTEIDGLKVQLAEALVAAGAMTKTTDSEGDHYSPKPGTYSAVVASGVWNYMVVYQDHGYGVHNPGYTRALLKNSIEALP